MRESKIEAYMAKQAKQYDTMYLKFTSPGNAGVPDRVLIHDGQVTFIELKRPGEEPRELQQKMIEKMRQHGAVVKVIDSIEAVDRYFLRQYEKDLEQGVNNITDNTKGCKPKEHKLYEKD